ncbi:MAG: transposase [Bacteriovoracaceae bacterium]
MFRENQKYKNPSLFPKEIQYPKYIQKRLENHWSTLFFDEVFSKIDESLISGMYCSNNGRPNVPVNVMMGLEILKVNFDLSDEELFEQLYFNASYQRALGITDLNEDYVSIKSLYNFRNSVLKFYLEHGRFLYLDVFQTFTSDIIEKFSIHTGTQRTDSVFIEANIKKMSRIALFHKVLSNLANVIQKNGHELTPGLKKLVSVDEDSFEFHLKPGEYDVKLKNLANLLHTYLVRWGKDGVISKTEEYMLAKRLFSEQCKIEKGKVKVKNKNDIDSGSMQNPSDPDATYKNKNGERHAGFLAQAMETCDKRNPFQVITNIDVTKNNVDDSKSLESNLPEVSKLYGIHTLIADGAYPSEGVRIICEKEFIDLIATDIRGKELQSDAITSKSFKFDSKGFITSCPKGHRPTGQILKEDRTVKAKFDIKICRGCPIRERCIAYKSEKASNLHVTASRRWIDDRMSRSDTELYRELCKMRASVEGTMEKLRPEYLSGRIRFRSLPKVKMRMVLRAFALNFRKVVKAIQDYFSFISGITLAY